MALVNPGLIHLTKDASHVFFNPVGGGYVVTNAQGARLIEVMQHSDDEDAVIETLAGQLGLDDLSAAARYVGFAESLKEHGILQQPVELGQGLPVPYFGFVEVTRKCPSMCRICAIDTGRASKDVLSLDEIRQVVDQLKEMGIGMVALTGGDPLMRPDLVDMLEYIRNLGLVAGFSSSLLTLDEHTARQLARLKVKVQVSLDGSTPGVNDYNRGQGSYEKAMAGINLLRRHEVEFRIAYCIMKQNLDDIPSMIRLAEELGAKEIAFRKIKLLGRALRLKDEVYPSPQEMTRAYTHLYRAAYGRPRGAMRINAKYNDAVFRGRGVAHRLLPCGAGRNIIHITYKGDIVPCSLFTEDKFIQGNVRQDSIAEVWRSSRLLSFFRETRVDDIPKCRECTYKYLCGGGCRAEAYFLKGDLMAECCDCEDLLCFYDYLLGASAETIKKVTI